MNRTPSEVHAIIDEIMIEEFECDREDLRPEAKLGEDLGMDSLDGVDLVVAIEKALSCRLNEDEVRGIRTLGDIYARVDARLRQPGAV
ncbi:MAG: acyl carrier protein [Planctomycetes bacterium]|nr:acyl carrier protein [Planctomycetota bacterium]